MSDVNVGFIGFGNMGRYLFRGLQIPPDRVIVTARSERTCKEAQERYGVSTGKLYDIQKYADVIFLCVKPNNLQELPKSFVREGQLLISVLAGVSIKKLTQRAFGDTRLSCPHILRLMPNLGVAIGEGAVPAAAFCVDQSCLCAAHREMSDNLLKNIGKISYVKENHLDACTAIFGSGPAYVCKFIELFADSAVLQGVSRQAAYDLAIQTFFGTAALLRTQGEHPAIIRERVCSPGGVAITGLDKMREKGLDSCIGEALNAATEKAKKLGQ